MNLSQPIQGFRNGIVLNSDSNEYGNEVIIIITAQGSLDVIMY
jgi:hypothetical protein